VLEISFDCCCAVLLPMICHKADAEEAQDHHCPSGEFGDGRCQCYAGTDIVAADVSLLLDILDVEGRCARVKTDDVAKTSSIAVPPSEKKASTCELIVAPLPNVPSSRPTCKSYAAG
jgi:hypothetical protein